MYPKAVLEFGEVSIGSLLNILLEPGKRNLALSPNMAGYPGKPVWGQCALCPISPSPSHLPILDKFLYLKPYSFDPTT
jgi:hypothetical protein